MKGLLKLLVALASISLSLIDPLLQLANGVDLYWEATLTSPIEVSLGQKS